MAELADPRRLGAIRELHLTDGVTSEVFDGATRLASRIVGVPVALMSIVTDEQQVFVSQIGLDEPWASRARTPLTHSFCQYVVTSEEPLRVVDARETHLRDNLAIPDLGVIAYYGVPLQSPDGQVLGSFCAIDGVPRDWTSEDLEALTDLARLVERVLVARAASSRLAAAVEERRNLAEAIVHDVRQPLSAARLGAGMLQRAGDELAPSRREEVVDALVRQVTRADDLLGELVVESEGVRGEVDLARVVQDVCDIASRDHDGTLTNEVPAGLVWRGDRIHADRIVANLVRNAQVHGGHDTNIVVRGRALDGGVRLVVSDDGAGIEPGDHERIFERKVQGRGAGSGSGLGLHIVRLLARESGGDVTVESEPGKGATFTVDLLDAAGSSSEHDHPGH